MNTNDFTKGLFPNSVPGFNLQDNENNKIINESIVLDTLGSQKALLEFYNNLGKFGARDGLLNECAATDIKLSCMNDCNASDASCILASAKEANDQDYDIYIKCIMLMGKCMENMKNKYSNIAKDRLCAQKSEVESNPRIQDAIVKTQETCEG